ncbi:MAG: hypothetical protein ACLQB1_43025, partial [Streptosporangiaceae bacterium]
GLRDGGRRDSSAASDTARDTVYRDLRSRGIDPIARHLPASDRQHYAPLGYEAADQLASLMSTVLLPSVICADPGPLANAAWMMGKAMTRIADLVDPDKSLSRHSSAENAEDLADSLSCALGHAHGYWASIQTSPELAARALDSAVNRCDSEAVAGKVTMTLDLPNATSLTVTLDQVSYAEPGGGFTTAAADSPLATGIDGKDHLEIRSALNMIGAVLTRHLAEDAFDD